MLMACDGLMAVVQMLVVPTAHDGLMVVVQMLVALMAHDANGSWWARGGSTNAHGADGS